jgi:hypothetical protein
MFWQLKLCRTGNDKSIYSKIPNFVFSWLWYRYISFIVTCNQHRICIIYRPVDRRIWRGVDEHAALQQIEPHAQPPPKQVKSSSVQSVINGEDRNVNNVYNTDHLLITCSASKPIYFYTRHHIPWKPHQHYQLTHNFVRCISNLPSASDRKLCFTLWQLKLCRQSVINGEDRNVNNVYNTDPMLITCDNKTDISISKSTKDKFWIFEYIDLSLPVRHNFNWITCAREILIMRLE